MRQSGRAPARAPKPPRLVRLPPASVLWTPCISSSGSTATCAALPCVSRSETSRALRLHQDLCGPPLRQPFGTFAPSHPRLYGGIMTTGLACAQPRTRDFRPVTVLQCESHKRLQASTGVPFTVWPRTRQFYRLLPRTGRVSLQS